MTLKLNNNNKDYLYWIYPAIILVLLVFAVKRDEHKRESHALMNSGIYTDSSLTIITQTVLPDSLKEQAFNDSILIFYATRK
jgi:hypothetical protein